MFNMMRNLGGSIGIAVLETFLTKREQFHSSVITARVSLLDPATRERIAALQGHFMAQRSERSRHRLARRGGADRPDRCARNPICWPTATRST